MNAGRRVVAALTGCVVGVVIDLVLFAAIGRHGTQVFGLGMLVGVVLTVLAVLPHLPLTRRDR